MLYSHMDIYEYMYSIYYGQDVRGGGEAERTSAWQQVLQPVRVPFDHLRLFVEVDVSQQSVIT